jgi:superkiller protein 3
MQAVDSLNDAAINFSDSRDFDSAISLFIQAIDMEPDNSLLWFNLGITQRQAGLVEQSIESYKRSVEIDPGSQEGWSELGLALNAAGELCEASECYLAALQLNPFCADAWNNMGAFMFQMRELEEARDCFERALSFNPYLKASIINLRDTYEELGDEKAAEEMARVCDSYGLE